LNHRPFGRALASSLVSAGALLCFACGNAPSPPEAVGESVEPLSLPKPCPAWATKSCTNEGPGGSQLCTCDPKDIQRVTTSTDPSAPDPSCQLDDTEEEPPAALSNMGCTLGARYFDPTQTNAYPLEVWACTSFVATDGFAAQGPFWSQCLGQPDSGFALVGATGCADPSICNMPGSGPCKLPPH
jgi:hypothetical protein